MYLVFVLFAAYAVFSLVSVVKAYRRGLSDGYKLYKGEPVISEDFPTEISEEERRAEIIRSNIENYNGSDEGQIDYNGGEL